MLALLSRGKSPPTKAAPEKDPQIAPLPPLVSLTPSELKASTSHDSAMTAVTSKAHTKVSKKNAYGFVTYKPSSDKAKAAPISKKVRLARSNALAIQVRTRSFSLRAIIITCLNDE